jgi:hypothetical protein
LVDNAGSIAVTVTGEGLSSVTPLPTFYCITSNPRDPKPNEVEVCESVYPAPSPIPGGELSRTVQLLNSPRVAPCVVSVLDGLAKKAEEAGAGKVPALRSGIAVLRIAALLADIPGFFEDYFDLIIELEQSGHTPEDLAYWADWTRGVGDILVKNGVDAATFESCRTLWTDPPIAR